MNGEHGILATISPTVLASTPQQLVDWIESEVHARAYQLRTNDATNMDDLIAWGRAHDVMKLMRMLATLDPELHVHDARSFLDAVRTQTIFTTEIMREYKSISRRLHLAEELLAAHGLSIPSEELEEVEHA